MSEHKQTVTAVHMLILLQSDLDKAIAFYEKLGLKKIFHIKDKWAEFRVGGVKIGLCPTDQSQDGNRTGIVLEVPDLHEAYQRLQHEVQFLADPKEATHGVMVSFKDPGGNILDLYQPTPEKVKDLVKKTAEQDEKDVACAKGKQCCQVTGQA